MGIGSEAESIEQHRKQRHRKHANRGGRYSNTGGLSLVALSHEQQAAIMEIVKLGRLVAKPAVIDAIPYLLKEEGVKLEACNLYWLQALE